MSKLLFWLLLSGVSLALILVIAASVAQKPEPSNDTEVAPGLSREVIKARYYHDIVELVAGYADKLGDLDNLAVSAARRDETKLVKDQALEMLVPGEAKGMHLDIVVALNFLEKGFGGSEEDLAAGAARFKEILAEYPWLLE